PVGVHVGEPRPGIVGAGSHVLVGEAERLELLRLTAGRRVEPDRARDLGVHDPEVALRRRLDARRAVAQLGRGVPRPELLRRVDVRVGRDQALVGHGFLLAAMSYDISAGSTTPLSAQRASSAWRPWTAAPAQASRARRLSASDAEIFGLRPLLALPIALASRVIVLVAAFSMRPSRFTEEPATAWAAVSLARMTLVFVRTTLASDGARSPGDAAPTAPSTAVSWVVIPPNPVEPALTQPVAGLQLSSVQTFPSSQVSGVPATHAPVAVTHVSLPLHALPSSQPRESLQRQTGWPASSRQTVPGLAQVNGGTSVQTPATHARPRQRPPQSASLAQGTQVGLTRSYVQPASPQVSLVHAFPSSHSAAVRRQGGGGGGRRWPAPTGASPRLPARKSPAGRR